MIVSWCPGDPCDPCAVTGNVECFGNDTGIVLSPCAVCFGDGSITSFPQFPFIVAATIHLAGIYRPGTGNILDSDGSTTITGNSVGIGFGTRAECSFPSTFFTSITRWDPAGTDQLLFDVTASCTTMSAAYLDPTTVSVLFHPTGGGSPINVWSKTRWIGNVG